LRNSKTEKEKEANRQKNKIAHEISRECQSLKEKESHRLKKMK
jgi:hypothetical protein